MRIEWVPVVVLDKFHRFNILIDIIGNGGSIPLEKG